MPKQHTLQFCCKTAAILSFIRVLTQLGQVSHLATTAIHSHFPTQTLLRILRWGYDDAQGINRGLFLYWGPSTLPQGGPEDPPPGMGRSGAPP